MGNPPADESSASRDEVCSREVDLHGKALVPELPMHLQELWQCPQSSENLLLLPPREMYMPILLCCARLIGVETRVEYLV
jgi:hypothetical protein